MKGLFFSDEVDVCNTTLICTYIYKFYVLFSLVIVKGDHLIILFTMAPAFYSLLISSMTTKRMSRLFDTRSSTITMKRFIVKSNIHVYYVTTASAQTHKIRSMPSKRPSQHGNKPKSPQRVSFVFPLDALCLFLCPILPILSLSFLRSPFSLNHHGLKCIKKKETTNRARDIGPLSRQTLSSKVAILISFPFNPSRYPKPTKD